ncbi:MAG: mechanosensitive ion channel family protein [Candidatus Pacebacteria bacterium]|nr:mechanosensitive ion channel family protein [Candidatus Paceibacterota bacterium]
MSTTTAGVYPSFFDPTTLLGALFFALVVIVLAWLVGSGLNLLIHRSLDRAEAAGTDSTSIRFLGQLGRVFVYILGFTLYAYIVPPLHDLGTAWLASVGLFSVVIGLATQSTLSNLIAGISVILYRPFRIGDKIEVATPAGPEIGAVESIDLGYTTLRAHDGRRVVVPNSIVASQTNINFSRNSARMLIELSVAVQSGSDIDQARKLFLTAAKTVPKIAKINGCFITTMTKEATTLMLSVMCFDPSDVVGIRSDVLEEFKKQLDGVGIALG